MPKYAEPRLKPEPHTSKVPAQRLSLRSQQAVASDEKAWAREAARKVAGLDGHTDAWQEGEGGEGTEGPQSGDEPAGHHVASQAGDRRQESGISLDSAQKLRLGPGLQVTYESLSCITLKINFRFLTRAFKHRTSLYQEERETFP